MKLAVCELPDGLDLGSSAWSQMVERLTKEAPDLLILNEMPIGDWIADRRGFDKAAALRFVRSHDALVDALRALPWATFGSRPVQGKELLANEAFLVSGGAYKPVHHKHFFPQEEGWYEQDWFAPVMSGFDVVEHQDLRIGALLCTELMFNEWARHYRRLGANVIAVPRATGALDTQWRAAGAMAATVSGCYVLSSNRAGHEVMQGSQFGGEGFVYAPDGEMIAQTSGSDPIAVVEIDLDMVKRTQADYPCYVPELHG
jgi:N-carbamoylputrescine amidase